MKRKHTKADEKIIFSVFFTNFHKTKILFFMQCGDIQYFFKKSSENQTLLNEGLSNIFETCSIYIKFEIISTRTANCSIVLV